MRERSDDLGISSPPPVLRERAREGAICAQPGPHPTLPRGTGGGISAGLALVAALLLALSASAQAASIAAPPAATAEHLKSVSVSEHPGNAIPLDLSFVDENGKAVQLRQYFSGPRPVVLQLGYYGCPMLCGLMSHGLVNAFKTVSLEPARDYQIVFVSIDPSETPALASQKKETYLAEYGRGGADGWHFLTGNQQEIESLAQAVGFRYQWIESARQFAHPAVMTLCTPDGRISRYLYGVRFDPQTLRLSLVEASGGKIGNAVDQLFLTCFQYDGKQGRYAVAAMTIMRTGGVIMMLVVGIVLVRLFRREAYARRRQGQVAQTESSNGT